jgi:hypothetical protein
METWRNTKQVKARHVPQRTCIGCRKKQNKQVMIRLVHTPDGRIEPDTLGKMSGRGTYLCKDIKCWENGLKGSRLEHSLKTSINQQEKNRLLNWVKEYIAEI